MKPFPAKAIFVLCLLFFCAPAAQAAERFLNIQEVMSPSGITAWLVEDHSLPVISLQFAFKNAGAALDPPGKQGLSQLASNTMDEGAGPYDSQAFQKTLADNSISFRFFSTRDNFGASFKTLTRHRDLGFDLVRLALTQPRFDADPVARMKAANMARLRSSLSDPEWIATRILYDTAFAGHPYALNAGGTLTSLEALTADDLKQFAKTRLDRDRLLVAVTGDISAHDLKAALDKIFGGLPATAVLPAIPDHTVQNGGKTFLHEMNIPQTLIQVMQPGIGRKDPDYYAAVVMNYILGGGGFGSRLTDSIREKRGLAYGVYTSLIELDHLKAIEMSTSTKNDTAGELMTLAQQEWRAMRDTPISAAELQNAKDYLIGSMPLSLVSTSAIAGLMMDMRTDGLPLDYLDRYSDNINAVTVDDVQCVAKRLLDPDRLTIVAVGKPKGIEAANRSVNRVGKLPNVE